MIGVTSAHSGRLEYGISTLGKSSDESDIFRFEVSFLFFFEKIVDLNFDTKKH